MNWKVLKRVGHKELERGGCGGFNVLLDRNRFKDLELGETSGTNSQVLGVLKRN